jgi:hypothetical protein
VAWNEPDGVNPRGTLVVIPGRGEGPSVYERFGRRLAADAYRVRVVTDPVANEALILGIHGADDQVSPLAQARARYATAPAAELVVINGGRHDALNDQTHRTVAATIVLFLERLRLSQDLPPIAVSDRRQ